MKIIAGNYFGKNIQFVCRCCNCVDKTKHTIYSNKMDKNIGFIGR